MCQVLQFIDLSVMTSVICGRTIALRKKYVGLITSPTIDMQLMVCTLHCAQPIDC